MSIINELTYFVLDKPSYTVMEVVELVTKTLRLDLDASPKRQLEIDGDEIEQRVKIRDKLARRIRDALEREVDKREKSDKVRAGDIQNEYVTPSDGKNRRYKREIVDAVINPGVNAKGNRLDNLYSWLCAKMFWEGHENKFLKRELDRLSKKALDMGNTWDEEAKKPEHLVKLQELAEEDAEESMLRILFERKSNNLTFASIEDYLAYLELCGKYFDMKMEQAIEEEVRKRKIDIALEYIFEHCVSLDEEKLRRDVLTNLGGSDIHPTIGDILAYENLMPEYNGKEKNNKAYYKVKEK